MQKEEFILRQLKRNVGLYRFCLIVFRIVIVLVLAAAVLSITGVFRITFAVHEAMIFAAVMLQYPAFRRLQLANENAAEEVEAALKNPDFRIPEDYSEETKFARSKTVQKPATVASQIAGFGLMAATLLGLGLWLFITECIRAEHPQIMLVILTALLFGGSVPMIFLTVRYAADYRAAKEISKLENGGN